MIFYEIIKEVTTFPPQTLLEQNTNTLIHMQLKQQIQKGRVRRPSSSSVVVVRPSSSSSVVVRRRRIMKLHKRSAFQK